MTDSSSKRITAVYTKLHSYPLCVVLRRHIDFQFERYDVYKPYAKIDGVIYVLKVLSNENPEFIERICQVDEKALKSNGHRNRRYVHTEQSKLYSPNRADLAKEHSRKLGNLWLATDLNTGNMQDVIQEACEAAQIEFGNVGSIKF